MCVSTDAIESPKSKDKGTWKGRMVRHFRRHGSASSASGDAAAKMSEVTGTFGVPLELCVPSTFSPVAASVILCKIHFMFQSSHYCKILLSAML